MKGVVPYSGSPEPEAVRDDEEDLSNLPVSTRRHRRNGRPSRKQKAAKQQYLTPQEEKAFVDYALHMDRIGNPLAVQSMRYIAMTIARQRSLARMNLLKFCSSALRITLSYVDSPYIPPISYNRAISAYLAR